jgi:hypothetical protein
MQDSLTPADLKTIADLVESICKSIALAIGGIWALYGFKVFRRRETAITTLRKTESELADLDLRAKRRAVLDIEITHDVRRDIVGYGYIIVARITATNLGVASARFDFEHSPAAFGAHRALFLRDGALVFENPYGCTIRKASDPSKNAQSRVIRAGGVSRMTAVVRVPSAGLYALTFRVPMDEENRKAMIEAGGSKNRVHAWSACAYACVGFPQNDTVVQKALPYEQQR